MPIPWRLWSTLLFLLPIASAQDTHNHSAPEKLGRVSFPISCTPAVQDQFNRGVALLHSFAYADAETAFRHMAEQDKPQEAATQMRAAADNEDALEKLLVTPGPILPARSSPERI